MTTRALAFSGATTEETKFIQEDAAAGKYIDLNANWSWAGAAYFRVSPAVFLPAAPLDGTGVVERKV